MEAKQLGKRMSNLRKSKGLSQEEVARHLGISRSAVTQLEQGNRQLSALELKRLAKLLQTSTDQILTDSYAQAADEQELLMAEEPVIAFAPILERVSEPVIDLTKMKNVLLYLLERCAGKPALGESMLGKLLYFCDFDYYERYEEHLSGATYTKITDGPVPQQLPQLLQQLIQQQAIQRIKSDLQGLALVRYLPLTQANLQQLSAAEATVIEAVIARHASWSTASLSAFALADMPCRASQEGEVIEYELALYREAPYSVRNYELEGDS